MCAKLAGEPKWRARGRTRTRQCCEDEEAEAEAEAEAVAVAPPYRGVIAPSLLCACADCRVCWKRSDVPLPIYRARGFSSKRVEECGRIIPSGLLCACGDCRGVGWKRSEGEALPIRGGCLRRPEEECLRRRSLRWRFWRRTSSREVIQSPEMGTLWDAFGPVVHAGAGDPSGCGIQRVVESVFSRDRVHDEEEKHRCILHFPSMREFFTHEEVEHALVQLGWKPLTKRGGWRRYFKIEEPTLPYGQPTIAKLPGRSFVDAPKPIILDFVRTVNKRENRNIFCCCSTSEDYLWLINMDYLNFDLTVAFEFHDEVYTGHCFYGMLHRISFRQIDETEGGHRQTELARNAGWLRRVRSSDCRTW